MVGTRHSILVCTCLLLVLIPARYGSGEVDTSFTPTRSGMVPNFVNVTSETGLDGVRGDSFVWGDWNADGWMDLLVKGSRLFRNDGGTFREVTAQVGLNNSGYSVFLDLNGDSYLDIFSVGHPYNYQDTVWTNDGPPDYSFTNVSSIARVDDGMPGLACAAGDIDHDGDLDIYVVNWRDDANVKYPDVLWRNDGEGRFTDITRDAGIVDWNPDRGEPNAGMGVNMGDYNDDGWIDIYVSNYLICPNYLWENQGDGTFVDVALEKGCAGEPLRTPTDTYYGHTAGSQWADYDNDRDLDLWCSNLAHKDPYRTLLCDDSELWRNDGPGTGHSFTNVRDETGIPTNHLGNEELFFGIAWGDFDNDGNQDMFIPQVKSYIDYAYSYLFRSNGDGTFTDVSDEAGFRTWDCVGGAWCDYDRDGDLDLIADGNYPYENGTYATRLYQNQGTGQNGIVEIDLRNVEGGPIVGSRVELYDGLGVFLGMREVEGGTAGHAFGPSTTVEFGIGARPGPFDVILRWPDGRIQYEQGIPRGSLTTIEGPLPVDIATGIQARDEVPEGDTLEVEVGCENLGGSDSKGVVLGLRDLPTGKWDREIVVGGLPAGEGWTDVLSLPTDGRDGTHTLLLSVTKVFPGDGATSNDVSEVSVLVRSKNGPPRIEEFDAQTRNVVPGGMVNLSARASDPDGDPLTYIFASTLGSFIGRDDADPNAIWIAPSGPEVREGADVFLSVTVKDGKGGEDEATLRMQVDRRMLPPVISRIEITSAAVVNDGLTTYRLEARVLDDFGNMGIWKVTCDLSALGGSEDAPMSDTGGGGDREQGDGNYSLLFVVSEGTSPGEKVIAITATDQDHLSSSQGLTVTVEPAPTASDRGPRLPLFAIIVVAMSIMALLSLAFIFVRSRRSLR